MKLILIIIFTFWLSGCDEDQYDSQGRYKFSTPEYCINGLVYYKTNTDILLPKLVEGDKVMHCK